MDNLFFLKTEIIVFIISFFYFCYYLFDRLLINYFKIRKIIKPGENNKIKEIKFKKQKKEKEIEKEKVINNENNNGKNPKFHMTKKISDEDRLKISEIIKKVKIHLNKGYYDSARGLIIEGLSLEKHNKDLNLFLAQIYEKEEKFENAEFIYRDLLELSKNDFEVKKLLAFNLAIQNNFDESFLIYEDVHKIKKNDKNVIDMLADLSYDMKNYKKCLKYVNLYLHEKPRDVEKMFMKSFCLEVLNRKSDAVLIYKKILQLQPYNTEARNKIKELDR